jgi:4-hydroxy-2-oxoheptanedioate aldolase
MQNQVRRKLEQGNNLLGMMHFTGSPMLIEVMAGAGMDFVNIDMEHSPIDTGLAAHLIRAADAAGIAGNYHPARHAGGLRGGRRCRALRARR